MLRKVLVAALTITLGLTSCQKEDLESPNDYAICHHETTWTTQDIEDALIGKWKMTESYCPFGDESTNYNVTAEFKSDGTIVFSGDDASMSETNWTIIDKGDNLFEVSTDPIAWEVRGL